MVRAFTTEEVIALAIARHGNKYSYDKLIYVNKRTKVIITCAQHGDFEQLPLDHTSIGRGCVTCFREGRVMSTEEFVLEAVDKHGPRYGYSQTVYSRYNVPVVIECFIHGFFTQTPNSHITGCGCPGCGRVACGAKQKNTHAAQFESRASLCHGNKYKYDLVHYIDAHHKVSIRCPKHGVFEQIACHHLQGHGCSKCGYQNRSSKAAIAWLTYRSEQDGVYIQHALNQGEHEVKDMSGRLMRFDGFSQSTNRVYEFLGGEIRMPFTHMHTEFVPNKLFMLLQIFGMGIRRSTVPTTSIQETDVAWEICMMTPCNVT